MKLAFASLLSFFSIFSFAQGPALLKECTWNDTNYFKALDTLTIDDDAHVLLQERTHDYYYEQSGDLYENDFFRQITYINTEKGVEDNNKIYLNTSNIQELLDYNARVLYKDKPSKTLGKDALKEGTTEEGKTFIYFAIEGIEVGCLIEYYYVKKSYPSLKGSYTYLQGNYPINETRFKLASPQNLIFEVNSMNGLNQASKDETFTSGNLISLTQYNIAKLPEEGFSNVSRSRFQIFYKLTANTANNSRNLFDFSEISQTYYESLLPTDLKKDKKLINKFLKDAQIEEAIDEREKIIRIENFIKKRVGVANGNDARLSDLASIVENGVTNEYGLIKLMFQALYVNDINFELVVTCSRYSTLFHKNIESYAFLDDILFYFPTIKDYLMPTATLYRLGIIPYGYIGNNGLFVKKVSIGDLVTGVGSVKKIDVYPRKHSESDMHISVAFDQDFEAITVELKQTFTGYNALNLQPVFDYVPADKVEEFKQDIVKGLGDNIEVLETKMEAEGADHFMIDPFIMNSTFKSEEFIELAGSKLLFKVGELIGPQAEMYEDEERLTDVVNTYNHGYTREITFSIPEGYKCANLNDLTLDIDPFKEEGSHTIFKSSYSKTENQITVTIHEFYDKLIIDKSRYEDFRSVINAAADFNKITLVFEEI